MALGIKVFPRRHVAREASFEQLLILAGAVSRVSAFRALAGRVGPGAQLPRIIGLSGAGFHGSEFSWTTMDSHLHKMAKNGNVLDGPISSGSGAARLATAREHIISAP